MDELVIVPVTEKLTVPVPEPLDTVNPALPEMATLLPTVIETAFALAPVIKVSRPLVTFKFRPTDKASAVVEVKPSVNPLVPLMFRSRFTVVKPELKLNAEPITEFHVKSEKD